jgi:hypothetical protein
VSAFIFYADFITTSQKVLFRPSFPKSLIGNPVFLGSCNVSGYPPSPTVGALSTGDFLRVHHFWILLKYLQGWYIRTYGWPNKICRQIITKLSLHIERNSPVRFICHFVLPCCIPNPDTIVHISDENQNGYNGNSFEDYASFMVKRNKV